MNQRPEGDRSKQRQRRAERKRPRLSVTLDEEQIAKIDRIAGKMSYSSIVAHALDDFLEKVEESPASFGKSRRSPSAA